jgi:hypothetical protein
MKKTLLYSIVLLLVLLASAVFFLVYQSRLFLSRATLTTSVFSVDNSYVFAAPLKAQANGEEKIRITVFVLNSQGLGVQGRTVILGQNDKLLVDTIQGTTDQQGKAIFDVSTKSPGEYYIEVKVDTTILPQKIQASFY